MDEDTANACGAANDGLIKAGELKACVEHYLEENPDAQEEVMKHMSSVEISKRVYR